MATIWCYRTAALPCYPFQKLKTNRGGSIVPNFLKGFLSENLVLSNRCADVFSIANTDNKHWRFDSTTSCEGLSFRKFGSIEPLRCCVIHGGSKAPNFLKGSLSDNLVLSNRCTAVLSIANTDNKHGRFDSTKFCEGFSLENLVPSNRCAAVLPMAVRKHQSFWRVVFQKTWCYRTTALLC